MKFVSRMRELLAKGLKYASTDAFGRSCKSFERAELEQFMYNHASRLLAVVEALKELQRLYDWRFELAKLEKGTNEEQKQAVKLLNQYGREKKAAWQVSRQALADLEDE